jgi:hypothetical protein
MRVLRSALSRLCDSASRRFSRVYGALGPWSATPSAPGLWAGHHCPAKRLSSPVGPALWPSGSCRQAAGALAPPGAPGAAALACGGAPPRACPTARAWTMAGHPPLVVGARIVGRRALPMSGRAAAATGVQGRLQRSARAVLRRALTRVLRQGGPRQALGMTMRRQRDPQGTGGLGYGGGPPAV